MKKISVGKVILFLGVLLSLIGLTYTLGYTDSIYFKYSFGIGIILFGFGVLFDGVKRKEKSTK